MKTYLVVLRNGDKVKVKADSYNKNWGTFLRKVSEEKHEEIASFTKEEIVGVVDTEFFVE